MRNLAKSDHTLFIENQIVIQLNFKDTNTNGKRVPGLSSSQDTSPCSSSRPSRSTRRKCCRCPCRRRTTTRCGSPPFETGNSGTRSTWTISATSRKTGRVIIYSNFELDLITASSIG